MDIYYNVDKQAICNAAGSLIYSQPQLQYMTVPDFVIHLVDSNGNAVNASGYATWRAAVDVDFSASTTPMCRTLNASIDKTSASTGILKIPVDARTAEFASALGTAQSKDAYFELYGYNNSAILAICISFKILARGVVDPDNTGTPPSVQGGYYTSAQTDALILSAAQAKHIYQFSADGSTNWHDTMASTDYWYRERKNVTGAAWGDALPLGRSNVIVDCVNHSFSTTADQTAQITFTKTALGIASDAEPQLSLWSVTTTDGVTTKQLINTACYTAVWSSDSLSITYYTAWPAGTWALKLS